MGDFSVDRRSLLKGMGTMVAVAAAGNAVAAREIDDPLKRVDQAAQLLANCLEDLHGGSWSVQINHETMFVAVSRDFS
ncbi:hypothetical protein [Rhizobium altiplani]|uniref:hypothetical protein n=1 Tax=Rhizobium altiplani TaxID=1864509 RepID=UPI0010421EEA|nr:hypothetical protein [Rhizobium altiplani]